MTDSSVSDHEIVHALSLIEIPYDTLNRIDLKGIISVVETASSNVQKTSEELENARLELKEGNFITNWWNKREEKVDDLQFSLQKSFGDLSNRTTQLLVFNTAISRELSNQQEVLLNQQKQLREQTLIIERQNDDILAQQNILEKQQHEISAANQGLLEAKGVTREQAQELIGCVIRVQSAEKKMEASNSRLLEEVNTKIKNLSDDIAIELSLANKKLTEEISATNASAESQINQAKLYSEFLLNSIVQDLANTSNELRHQFDERLRIIEKYNNEIIDSVRNDIKQKETALSESIQENHSSLSNDMKVLAHTQDAERSRLETAFGNRVLSIKDDFRRRSKKYLVALIVSFCISFANAGMQIANYIHH
jgi:hypothetical protein